MPAHRMSPRRKVFRVESALDRDKKEAKIQLALAELQQGRHANLAAAALAHNVPKTTLFHRQQGRSPKRGAHGHLQALSPAAEDALMAHIRRCSTAGFPLTPGAVHDLAETISSATVGGQRQRQTLGQGWFRAFLLRHPDLNSQFSRCLDNARLKAVTEDRVWAWFNNFSRVMGEYKLSADAIFNMDETGFMMGVGGRQRVVVPKGPKAVRFKNQVGNRESTTVIECIGSGGQSVPPMLIFKGKWHLLGDQRRYVGVEKDWAFGVSANGWTSCDLAVAWLKHVFDPATEPLNKELWRMLVVDGHTSHVSVEFLDECWRRRIVPMCLPPHSTHLMQPLDVSMFGPLTDAYRRQVVGLGDSTDKVDRVAFANMYVNARKKVFSNRAVRKAFADCGMTIRPDATKVLARLPSWVPPPPSPRPGLRSHTPPPIAPPPIATTPADTARFRTLLEELVRSKSPVKRQAMQQKLINAYEGKHAGVAIWERHEQQRQAAALPKKTALPGDRKMLSKEKMITRAEAEVLMAELERRVEKEVLAKQRKDARKAAQALDKAQEAQEAPGEGASDEDDDDEDDSAGGVILLDSDSSLPPDQEEGSVRASDEAHPLSEALIDPLLWSADLLAGSVNTSVLDDGDINTQDLYDHQGFLLLPSL